MVANNASLAAARHRLGPAVAHLLVGCCLLPFTIFTFLPFVAVFAVANIPWLHAGLGGSDDDVGLPRSWLRRRARPCSILFRLSVDVPLAILYSLWMLIIVFTGQYCLHVAFEAWSALPFGWCRPNAPPLAHRVEAPFEPPPGDVEGPAAPEGQRRSRHLSASVQIEDGERYRAHASVWAALEGDGDRVRPGDVRLLSLAWLMRRAASGGTLPRRQDLPEDAFLDAARLREIETNAIGGTDVGALMRALSQLTAEFSFATTLEVFSRFFHSTRNVDQLLPVVAISYCWLEAAHPDRDGRQLQQMCDKLGRLYGGRGLLGVCRDYGFADMGVFLDWASLYQKDPKLWVEWMADLALYKLSDEELTRVEGGAEKVAERRAYEQSRSGDQKGAFDRALHNTMDLWYGHAKATAVLLTDLPRELPAGFDSSRAYDTRGWTTFERCSAELAKSFKLHKAKWKLVIDVADADGGARRRVPTTPEQMVQRLQRCKFTNGADASAVLALYKKTATAVLGTIETLDYWGLSLVVGDEWCSPLHLGQALNYCMRLRVLHVGGTQLDDKGMAAFAGALAPGALPALRELSLGGNRLGARGVQELCDALRHDAAPALQTLVLNSNLFGSGGVIALADALWAGGVPRSLTAVGLDCNDVGDEGAVALAGALLQSGAQWSISITSNRIGVAAQAALLKALEARHGFSFGHFVAVAALNPPFYPSSLGRAIALGARRMAETGRFLA